MDFLPLIENFTSLIPRFLWPDKPLVMSAFRVQELYLFERFSGPLGETVSTSLPGSAIISGGVLFMVFSSFMIGIIYKYVYEKAVLSKSWIMKGLQVMMLLLCNSIMRQGVLTASTMFHTFVSLSACWLAVSAAWYVINKFVDLKKGDIRTKIKCGIALDTIIIEKG
jgi:hypothetical protein